MSEEEPVRLRRGEESDLLAAAEAEAWERSQEIAGSFLRSCRCTACGQYTLAVPEKVLTAMCGPCLQARTGAGGYRPDGTYGRPAGDTLVRQREECVCGASLADHRRRADWTPYVPHQPAERSSAEPWPAGVPVPSAVLKLRQWGAEAGWRVALTYSRGYAVKQYRGAWQLEERIAVRFAPHSASGNSAVAVYRRIAHRGTWAWQSIWLWGPALLHFGWAGMAELNEWLAAGGVRDAGWYAAVRSGAQERAAAARERAAARPKKPRGETS